MMKLVATHVLATAAAVMAVAVGVASPAFADPPTINGTYSGGDVLNLWTIATTCDPMGCTGTVSSNQGWTVPATLVDGMWNFKITKPDGAICSDGSYAPAFISLALDPVTLAGTITTDSNYDCPGGTLSQAPFQLHRVGGRPLLGDRGRPSALSGTTTVLARCPSPLPAPRVRRALPGPRVREPVRRLARWRRTRWIRAAAQLVPRSWEPSPS